jgi:RNA polymerase sigma-70 factor, ECF subfamily
VTGAQVASPMGGRALGLRQITPRTLPPRAAACPSAAALPRPGAASPAAAPAGRDTSPGQVGLRALADEDLMELARGGEVRAFEVIFDRHASAALSLAHRICRRRATAEDVVQEAFLALWRHGARYERARGSVRSWLLSVVHNRAIDAVRRSLVIDRRTAGDSQIAERLAAPGLTDNEVVRRDEAARVRQALGQLPPEQRRVIELSYFGGLTHSQIAEFLELAPGTVKGRMRLGLQKMRVVLA